MGSLIIVFLSGAVLGTALDRLHFLGGVLDYPDTTLQGQAWFVPPLMGAAALGLVSGHRLLVRMRGGVIARGSFGAVLTYVLLFAAAYGATVWFQDQPKWLAIGLVVAFVPVIGSHPYNGFGLHCLLAAAVGTAVEAYLVQRGEFRYLAPDWLGVPMWLPALYLWAAAATAEMDRFLREKP